jgi:hypothetical protein
MKFVHHLDINQGNVGQLVWMQTAEWYWEVYTLGHTHVNHLLSTMNIPTISHKAYKAREREVGHCVETVAQESCSKITCEEKKIAHV